MRFSPGLFLSGLKSHKPDSIQVDRQKRIVDRSRQFSHVSRFVPQEFVEGTQEPYIVDSEMNASPLGHNSLLSSGWSCRNSNYFTARTCKYIHHPHLLFNALTIRQGCSVIRMASAQPGRSNAKCALKRGDRCKIREFSVLVENQGLASQGKER